MKRVRLLHLYLGVFFAPAILFFSFTGALQTFGFHEAPRDGSYVPPAWLVSAGQIHKKQGLSAPQEPGPSASPTVEPSATRTPGPDGPPPRRPKMRVSWPLKWFTLAMSLGLIATTLLGIYMAFKYNRGVRLIVGLLVAGTLLPVLFLYL